MREEALLWAVRTREVHDFVPRLQSWPCRARRRRLNIVQMRLMRRRRDAAASPAHVYFLTFAIYLHPALQSDR